MSAAKNSPVHTPVPIVRATAVIGIISGALAIGWAAVLIIGAFFQQTVSFGTVTKGFALFLIVSFVFTAVSAVLDDSHQAQERRAEARRREHARAEDTQMVKA